MPWKLETVGDRPSLRFEVTNPAAQTMYPADETPVPVPGVKFERARVASAKGSYDEANVPYIDYNLTIAGTQKPKKNPTQFIGDAHDGGYVNVGIVNILRGDPNGLAHAICDLFSDSERLSRMSIAAREAAESRFGWDRSAARLETVYERALPVSPPLRSVTVML